MKEPAPGCSVRKKGWDKNRERAWQPQKLQDVRVTFEAPNKILQGQDAGFEGFWWEKRTESWGTTGAHPRSSPYLREQGKPTPHPSEVSAQGVGGPSRLLPFLSTTGRQG